jgi:foldase protein PrsA
MRILVRRLSALGAFFVVGLAAAGCGSGVPGNSVASVAGNPITLKAFHHWIYVAAKSQAAQQPGAPVIVPSDPPKFTKCIAQVKAEIPTLAKAPTKTLQADCKQVFTQLSSEVMDFLIKAYWYQAEAAKQHIKVTDAEVMKAFNTAKKGQFHSDTEFKSFLSQTGETLPDILYRFRINTITTKLIKKLSPKITQQQISNFYNQHKSSFGTPETRDIRIVLTKDKNKALAAKKALAHHQSWDSVAKKYSTDPTTKSHGGLLVGVRQGQEDKALDAAAFSAPLNKLLGPVKGAFGYYVFEVTKITKATQRTLAQSTATIKAQLQQQQGTAAQTKLTALVKKNWFSKTTCQAQYAIQTDCSNFHPPSTSTSGTSGTPPPTTPPTTTTSTTPTTSTK